MLRMACRIKTDSVGLQVHKAGLKNDLYLGFCSGILNSISTLILSTKEWKNNGSRKISYEPIEQLLIFKVVSYVYL